MYMYSSRRRQPSEKDAPPLTHGPPSYPEPRAQAAEAVRRPLTRPCSHPRCQPAVAAPPSPPPPCPALPEREQSWGASFSWSTRRERSSTVSSTLGRGLSGLRHCGSTRNTHWNLQHRGPERGDTDNPIPQLTLILHQREWDILSRQCEEELWFRPGFKCWPTTTCLLGHSLPVNQWILASTAIMLWLREDRP